VTGFFFVALFFADAFLEVDLAVVFLVAVLAVVVFLRVLRRPVVFFAVVFLVVERFGLRARGASVISAISSAGRDTTTEM
jgi:hypothetical protein